MGLGCRVSWGDAWDAPFCCHTKLRRVVPPGSEPREHASTVGPFRKPEKGQPFLREYISPCLGMTEQVRSLPAGLQPRVGIPRKKRLGSPSPWWPLETFERWLSNSWACCAGMKWPGQAGAGGRPEGHQPQSRGSPPGALIGTKGRPCFPVGVLSHQLSREAGQSPASPHVHRRHPQ